MAVHNQASYAGCKQSNALFIILLCIMHYTLFACCKARFYIRSYYMAGFVYAYMLAVADGCLC